MKENIVYTTFCAKHAIQHLGVPSKQSVTKLGEIEIYKQQELIRDQVLLSWCTWFKQLNRISINSGPCLLLFRLLSHMHTFAAERDSITYQSQQKWLSHFQEQGVFLKYFFLATWKHQYFHAKSRYLAAGHKE